MATPFSSPAPPPPSIQEVDAALTPLEQANEDDYEEMLLRLYSEREDYDSLDCHSNDSRYWL